VPEILLQTPIIPAEYTTIFMIMLPLSLFYIVLSKEFIDMDFVIRKSYYAGLVSFAVTTLIMFTVLIIGGGDTQTIVELLRTGLLIFLLVGILFYFKDHIDYSFRKKLHPKQKDYQASLNRFVHRTHTEIDIERLISSLKHEIEVHLPVAGASVTEKVETGELEAVTKDGEGFSVNLYQADGHSKVLKVKLGTPRKKLSVDEMTWLETLVNYAQIMTENIQKVKEVMKNLYESDTDGRQMPSHLSKLLLSISDHERKSLARDLHDTVLQDQLNLARQLDAEAIDLKEPEMAQRLQEIRTHILDHAHVLRKVMNELHPASLHEAGLKQTLVNYFDEVRLEATFQLNIYIPEEIVTSKKVETAVYRIVQELLNNALQHAKATKVSITIFQEDHELYLDYRDDGIGCDLNKIERKFSTRGLIGIRERVHDLNGTLQVNTEKGKGFQAEITFENLTKRRDE
jgi:two-component system sensor histidine kinase ComP